MGSPAGLNTDALVAGLAAAMVSGVPSTAWTLARGGDITEGARAAGALLLPGQRATPAPLAASIPGHLTISLGWAALDLGVIGRRIPAIRALDQPPQWADHIAFGLTVGAVLRARRS